VVRGDDARSAVQAVHRRFGLSEEAVTSPRDQHERDHVVGESRGQETT
jgi:hypothetical protein